MSLRGGSNTDGRHPRFVAGWWIVPSLIIGWSIWTAFIRIFF